jgi:hypothetical protein
VPYSLELYGDSDKSEADMRTSPRTSEGNKGRNGSDARGVLLYRIYRFCHALNELFSSDYSNWLSSKRYQASANASKPATTSEYIYVVRDMMELLSSDAEVSGSRKMNTAARMARSYQCLAAPIT